MVVIDDFPNSKDEPFTQTSHIDVAYNCIAWAAADNSRWYEPDPFGYYYWPDEVAREYTIEAYVGLYEFLGYEKCESGNIEDGFIKIAVFANEHMPTHAARQLPNGNWTSKLGKNIDVEHTIYSIEGGAYGQVIQYLRKVFI
jgi:hypothetical protein